MSSPLPKPNKEPILDTEDTTTLIHQMNEGDEILIDGKTRVQLRDSRKGRASICIQAPRSVRILRNTQKRD